MSNLSDSLEALLREEFNKIQNEPLDNLSKEAQRQYEDTNRELGTLNVLVIGKTGVGKSTLLNAVFGKNLAQTGTVSSIFGLSPNSDFTSTVVQVLTGAGGATFATTILPSLIKTIPAIGTLPATGVALVTYPIVAGSVGTAYTKGLKVYLSGKVNEQFVSPEEEQRLRQLFAEVFRKTYEEYVAALEVTTIESQK